MAKLEKEIKKTVNKATKTKGGGKKRKSTSGGSAKSAAKKLLK
jgi:hypothetical protein